MAALPLSRTDLSYSLFDGSAERGVVVKHGDADLEFRNLTVEVPCHEALPQQFHAVHLRLHTAPAAVTAPSSPEGPAEMVGRSECFVSCGCAGGGRLPRLGVLARWNDGVGHRGARSCHGTCGCRRRHPPSHGGGVQTPPRRRRVLPERLDRGRHPRGFARSALKSVHRTDFRARVTPPAARWPTASSPPAGRVWPASAPPSARQSKIRIRSSSQYASAAPAVRPPPCGRRRRPVAPDEASGRSEKTMPSPERRGGGEAR